MSVGDSIVNSKPPATTRRLSFVAGEWKVFDFNLDLLNKLQPVSSPVGLGLTVLQ